MRVHPGGTLAHGDDTSILADTLTSIPGVLPGEPRISLLFYHRDGTQMVPLVEGQAVVVGRARPADVPIRDSSLSRQHARFELIEGQVWVEDLGSTNGTLVNRKKITRCLVKATDEVRLGSVIAVLHVLAPDAPASGLSSHDRFMDLLEQEVVRAQTFGRRVSVLMVRAAERKQGHLSRWWQRVQRLLRPVDSIALYDASSVLVLLAETTREAAQALAEAIVAGRARGESQLLCGVATFPESATSAQELLESVRQAARQATGRKSLVLAGPGGEGAVESGEEKPVVLNPQVIEVFATARRVADAATPVLIGGETGTGKEVLARAIHEHSQRRKRPLRCLNCAAIPEQLIESALFGHERGAFTGANQQAQGIFEEADGGTVLLDEVGELSPSAQAALLRVIETKKVSRVGTSKEFAVDVRILAATNRDLEQMCQAGEFRLDLFYRLNTISLRLPPLRERPEEILPLAESFLRAASRANRCRVRRIDPEAAKLLQRYSWPGNIRELRNVIERAVLIAQEETVAVDDLSERIRQAAQPPGEVPGADEEGASIKDKVRRYEASLLLEALRANEWNQTRTADSLGMPLRTLVHKMRVLGLKKKFESD